MAIYKVLTYIWLDTINKCYKKILTVNNKPEKSTFSNNKNNTKKGNHPMMIYIVAIDHHIAFIVF